MTEKRKAHMKAYYKAHEDEIREYKKKYYEAHKTDVLAYREAHKEEIKEYNQAHKEEMKEYSKAYRQAHKEERKEYKQAHKDKIRENSKEYYEAHKTKVNTYSKFHGRQKYCCEDLSQIENYSSAKADNFVNWDIHHRLETNSDVNLSRKELKALDMYYNRPASELIFITHGDHISLHNKKRNTK